MKKILITVIGFLFLTGCGQPSVKNDLDTRQSLSQKTTLTASSAEKTDTVETVDSVLDLVASKIEWRGGKIIGGDHWGEIKLKSADIEVNDNKITAGTVVVDMKSMTSTDLEGDSAERILSHLMNDDFFAVDTFPEATFVFDTVTYSSETEATGEGNLTIKGITNPISFNFTQEGTKISAELVLDRTNWDVKYGSGKFFDDLGDKAIKDEMILTLTLFMKDQVVLDETMGLSESESDSEDFTTPELTSIESRIEE